jgi:acyl-CoA thioesterase I
MKKLLILLVILLSTITFANSSFIEVVGNEFELNGNTWRPFGIHYWPLSAETQDTSTITNHWLHETNYNIGVTGSDLQKINSFGFNTVGIQLKQGLSCTQINTFLNQAKTNNLKVFIFLPSCDPQKSYIWNARLKDFDKKLNFSTCTKYISDCGFKNNDTIFAYDIAWEPRMGSSNIDYYNYAWTEWLKEKYGNLETARTSIGYAFQFDSDGYVKAPTSTEVCGNTGTARNIFAHNYLKFNDDFIARNYSDAYNAIKNVDPNHLITARTGFGILNEPDCFEIPVDVRTSGLVMDFSGPEFYENFDLSKVKQKTGLVSRYASMNNKKPVVFVEFGKNSITDGELRQKNHFQYMYDAMQESGTQGSIAWWYIGERVKQNTTNDFGILRPDRSERPVVNLIKNYANRMTTALPAQTIDSWVVLDMDSNPNRAQIRDQKSDAYKTLIDQGKTPKVSTSCTGTTSKEPSKGNVNKCIGNKSYDWKCPLTCLNSMFEELQIKNSQGNWVNVKNNLKINVSPNSPIYIKGKIKNIGEATWLDETTANGRTRSVALVNSKNTKNPTSPFFEIPMNNKTEFLDYWELPPTKLINGFSGFKTINFSLSSIGLAKFGEKITNVTLSTCGSNYKKIMFIGDSITEQTQNNSYRHLIWEKMKTDNFNCVNFIGDISDIETNSSPANEFDWDHSGHAGFTAERVAFGDNDPFYAQRGNIDHWLLDDVPDIASIYIGINDFRHDSRHTSLTRTASANNTVDEIEEIIDLLREKNPDVKILVSKIYPAKALGTFSAVPITQTQSFANRLENYLVATKSTARSPIILVDNFTGFNLDNDTSDGVHPNIQGATKIANNIYQLLKPLLNQTNTNPPQLHTICSQFTERYTNSQWLIHKTNWRNGTHSILEIIKRAKLWKYCNQ